MKVLKLLSPLIRATPVLGCVSWVYAYRPRVLLYHRFAERTSLRHLGIDLFEAEVKLIRERFTPLTLSGLLDAIAGGRPVRNAVVITIDDGYEDVHRHAFPVLRRYGVPATLYVTAGFLEGKLWLWPDVIAHVLMTTSCVEYDGPETAGVLPLRSEAERYQAWRVLGTHGETLPAADLQTWLGTLADALGVSLSPSPAEPYRPMSWQQLKEMADWGIEIGDHSWSHPLLTRCDPEELQRQVVRSKSCTEARLQQSVRSFAYPHGAHSPSVRRAVQAAGFTSAVALDSGAAVLDPFEIPRLSSGTTLAEFRDSLYGLRFLAKGLGVSI